MYLKFCKFQSGVVSLMKNGQYYSFPVHYTINRNPSRTQVCIQYENLIYNNIELCTFFATPNISLGTYLQNRIRSHHFTPFLDPPARLRRFRSCKCSPLIKGRVCNNISQDPTCFLDVEVWSKFGANFTRLLWRLNLTSACLHVQCNYYSLWWIKINFHHYWLTYNLTKWEF